MSAFERAPQFHVKAVELLKGWGWSGDVPRALHEYACNVARINPDGKRMTGEIIIELGYLTRQQVNDAPPQPNSKTPYFTYLTKLYPTLQRHQIEVLAIKDRLPFYSKLGDYLTPHNIIEDIEEVRIECEKIDALLARLPNGRSVLVFATYEEFLRYRQRGTNETRQSPLANALKDDNSPHPLLFGFGRRDDVIAPLRQLKKENSAIEGGTNTGKLFYAERNRSTERSLAVDMLENGVTRKASDLSLKVLSTGEGEIHYRENGVRLHSYRLSMQERIAVSNFLMQQSKANSSGARLMQPETGRMVYKGQSSSFEMRCSFIPGDAAMAYHEDDQLLSISMRYLEQNTGDGYIDIDTLSFTDEIKQHLVSALHVKKGILLLVGPTNSGKSTTLAAFLSKHYDLYGDRVKRLSLEDPKERTIIGVEQFSLPSAKVYEKYLEGFLRHDPDVILFSEIRSKESAETATRAALTGHLVLSTFHATDPVEAYTSLAHLMSEDRQHDLLSALVMIITQRLVPKLCPVCSEQRKPTEDEWSMFRYSMALRGLNVDEMAIHKDSIRFAKTPHKYPDHKCDRCSSTGYVGVYPIHGILDFTKKVRALLRTKDFEEVEKTQAFTLEQQAIKALHAGFIDLEGVSA